MYIPSNYNIFYKNFVYNLISKNYLELNDDLLAYLKETNEVDPNMPQAILDVFKRNNIVVDFDELQYLDYRYNSLKFTNKKASYIIYPTLSCNFKCYYCFESLKKGVIREKETKILELFFKNKIKKLKEISIRWSGGEPLIVWNSIKQISNVFKSYKGDLIMSMATNGYLLTDEIAREMKELNFSSIQITVDGTKQEHNRIRFAINDSNTYDKVLEGIKNSSKYMMTKIRLNVDNNNKNSFEKFLIDLDKYDLNKKNISLYVKPIRSSQNCAKTPNILEEKQFFDLELLYIQLAKQYNFKYSLHPNFNSAIRCIYHHIDSYAIDPKLRLYKCAENIGLKEYQVGKINKHSKIEIDNISNYQKSLMYSPISLLECRECKILPICNGKCPIEWEKSNKKENEGCIPEKQTIEAKIEQILQNEI